MPGTHSALSRHLFTLNGNVLTSGGAKNLAKGQFTIVKTTSPTPAGAAVVAPADFATMPANQVLEMRLGKHNVPSVRTALNSKPFSSETFKLGSIRNIKKITPIFTKQKFDELIVGYDGINDDSAIVLEEGQHAVLDILVKGDHVGFVTNSNSYITKFHFGREFGETNQEAIQRAVESLKAMTLTNGVSIEEVLDITLVDSTNVALTGTSYTFFKLNVVNDGDTNDLADVQAQYPTFRVLQGAPDGDNSSYTILAPTATVLPAYTRTSIVVTDANCDGIPETTPTTVTTAWVAGEACFASTQDYKIQLADGDCTDSRLAELQAYYPNLVITKDGVVGGCQGVYLTSVITNVVCDECSPIFLEQFTSEPPTEFEFNSWELVTVAADPDAKMGIKIRGKAFEWTPTDISRDQIPFYETSTRVEVSGGYIMEVNQSFQDQFGEMFQVTRTSRAQDRDNLGGHLMSMEEASRYYFDGEERHRDNMYARQVLGEESVLDYKKQYVQYAVTIHDNKYSQGVGRTSDMGTTYNVWAELGKQANLDALMSALATKVGMPF